MGIAGTQNGRLWIVRSYRLFYQMTRITKERGSLAKDDRIDALALAVHYWTERLAQDVQDAARRHREEALLEEMKMIEEQSLFKGLHWNQAALEPITVFQRR
jgi:hypothetical protein